MVVARGRWTAWLPAIASACCALVGCGSGGGGPAPVVTTPVLFDVDWAARSREPLLAPSSALSLRLVLKGAKADGTDAVADVDREADPAAYRGEYSTAPVEVLPGTWPLEVSFYADAGGAGATVGTITASVTIAVDGSGIGTLTTVGAVAAVEVPAGQALLVGEQRVLTATARDAEANLLALTPGSFAWAVESGAALRFDADTAVGLAAGAAEVTASVDGKTSTAVTVSVAALPDGLAIDDARTEPLDVAAGDVLTPREGLTLYFPTAAEGTLSTARLTNDDDVPVTGGQGFQIASSDDGPIEIRLPKVDGKDVRVLLRTATGGAWDYAPQPAMDWMDLPARDPGDGYLYFALPRQAVTSRGLADYVDTVWSVTVDPPPHAGTVRNKIIIHTGKILDQLSGPLAAHYSSRYATRGFRLYFRDPNRGSYFWVTTAFGPTIYLTTDASDPVIAHETSHYATYLLCDDAGWAAFESAAEQVHAIGDEWSRDHALTDDYAYFIQQFTGQPENGAGSFEPMPFALLVRKAPSQIDYPSLEAFASVLMTSMTWKTTPQTDFAKARGPVPTPAIPVVDLMQIIADGTMTLNALRDKLEALLVTKGQPREVLQVIAERCGWSYHAKGTLHYATGAALAGIQVQSVVKYGTQVYVAGTATTGGDGSFVLDRVFPGDHWLRATIDGAPRDLPLVNPWSRRTPDEIDLGTVNAGLPSILEKLRTNTVGIKSIVASKLFGGTVQHPTSWEIKPGDWTSSLTCSMRLTETGASGGCVGQVDYLAEAEFAADGQSLVSAHQRKEVNTDCSPTFTEAARIDIQVTAIPFVGGVANGPNHTDYRFRLASPDVGAHAPTALDTVRRTLLVAPFGTTETTKQPTDYGGVDYIEVIFTCPN